jgi:hypothetical protein
MVISADAPSSYGLTPDFIFCDEVSHWKNSALWESLFSAAAKRASCLLVCILNAGFHDSWVWPVRESARTSPNWYFNALPGPMASWITPDRLEEQKRMLPAVAYARLWLNQWSAGSGDALSDAEITRALTQAGPMKGNERGWQFVAGLDLGLSRDASALVTIGQHVGWQDVARRETAGRVVGSVSDIMFDLGLSEAPIVRGPEAEWIVTGEEPATGRLRLGDVETWRGSSAKKLDLEVVERAILAAHQKFNGTERRPVAGRVADGPTRSSRRAGESGALRAIEPARYVQRDVVGVQRWAD